MSRSYKHTGWIQDQSSKKYGKRFANKRVRRFKDKIPLGSSYQKIFKSWNISDYIIPCRGKLLKIEHRPGRKFKKVILGNDKNSFWWLDLDDHDKLWKDWKK